VDGKGDFFQDKRGAVGKRKSPALDEVRGMAFLDWVKRVQGGG
jgi:hypothetical protein